MERYGRLTVLGTEWTRDGSGRSMVLLRCLCDCGVEVSKPRYRVRNGRITSCGCAQREMRAAFGPSRTLPVGEAARRQTYYSYQKGAERRGYSFTLGLDEFFEMVVQPCTYCGERGGCEKTNPAWNGSFGYTGIDRVDNNRGYEQGNVVPCCRWCNKMKSTFTADEFLRRVRSIANHTA